MNIINQPWNGRMFAHLNELLESEPRFDRLAISVAFAKRSGVNLVKRALQAFIAKGGSLEVIVGVDHMGTTKQALEELLQVTSQVSVFHDNRLDRTFHPKLYLFERPAQRAVAFVGSSNLTAGGLYSNYEINTRFDFNLTMDEEDAAFEAFSQTFQQLASLALELDNALLNRLEQCKWIGDETSPDLTPQETAVPDGTEALSPIVSPFPPIHVPPGPSIPKPRPVLTPGVSPVSAGIPLPTNAFLMTLQRTDTSKGGRSPDVFIPLEARQANPAFWEWPQRFHSVLGAKGSFNERYSMMCISRANQPASVRNVSFRQ